jgi:hypothetical protein
MPGAGPLNAGLSEVLEAAAPLQKTSDPARYKVLILFIVAISQQLHMPLPSM